MVGGVGMASSQAVDGLLRLSGLGHRLDDAQEAGSPVADLGLRPGLGRQVGLAVAHGKPLALRRLASASSYTSR